MNTRLKLEVVHPENEVSAVKWAAALRVQPARGNTIVFYLDANSPSVVAIEPGTATIQCSFPSGQVEVRQITAIDGEESYVRFEIPRSPHEQMRWLNLSRQSSAPPILRPVPKRSLRALTRTFEHLYNMVPTQVVELANAFSTEGLNPAINVPDHLQRWLTSLSERGSEPTAVEAATLSAEAAEHWQVELQAISLRYTDCAVVTLDETYPEARVLHISCSSDPMALTLGPESALTLLCIGNGSVTQALRFTVLPLPLQYSQEVHVALRAGTDPLPDVQITVKDPRLASVIGFLENRDQIALELLREQFLESAVEWVAGKARDPILATIGLALLLRLQEPAKVEDWPRNLWSWFPGLPDGAALYVGVLLQKPDDSKQWIDTLREAALHAASCGLPLLTDSLRYLRDGLLTLRDVDDDAHMNAITRALRWCDRIHRGLDGDSVFTCVTLANDERTLVQGVNHMVDEDSTLLTHSTLLAEHRSTRDSMSKDLAESFKTVLQALRTRGAELAAIPGVAAIRPGFHVLDDETSPAIVLAMHPQSVLPSSVAWSEELGVLVLADWASAEEQLAGSSRPSFSSPLLTLLDPTTAPGFAPPRRGTYEPPTGADAPRLDQIDEDMEVTLCASPDAGWPVLRDFLAEDIESRLSVAMYDFTAAHVEGAIAEALEGTEATFRLVLDGKTASGGVGGTGINGQDSPERKVMERLSEQLGPRFELVRASVGSGGAVPTAYHIKVAVADGKRTWLSSGNWQSSNLAPFDYNDPESEPPFPRSRYNRDYHAVVRNESLASCFEKFIEYDATLGSDYAGEEYGADPMLWVPDELDEPEGFATARHFEPRTLTGPIKVTPLLTPDNFPGFVNELLANASERVWIQNQYIKPNAEGDNFPEFERLVELLGELAERVDLRIALRSLDAAYRDRLLAAGVRPSQIRRQGNCHAKLIIIDEHVVVVGSQNMSNDGYVANRDASLAFESEEAVQYFAEVFEHDWGRLKPMAEGEAFAAIVAKPGMPVPAGYRLAPWSEIFDTRPPLPHPGMEATMEALPEPTGTVSPEDSAPDLEIPFFGVNPAGERELGLVADVADALRGAVSAPSKDLTTLGHMLDTPAYGLPPGASAESLSDMGWAVVWGPGTTQEVKDALRPLLDHRRNEVGDLGYFREYDLGVGVGARSFLQSHSTDYGAVRPETVPYYLLLVGTPEQIPFEFQTLLDVEYRVGRLDLPDATAYASYAKGVVAVETGAWAARDRVLHSFGPAHPGDVPTQLSARVLVGEAATWLKTFKKLSQKHGLECTADQGDAATKARLVEILRGKSSRPELLFTASHGLVLAPNSPLQATTQGALVTADWPGLGPIDASSVFAASDLPSDADLGGLVTFLFACFGAGTPQTDSFPTRAGAALSAKAFSSALPRALLSHPKGPALGVFGHIDRTLTWSLQPPGGNVATEPFANAAMHVLSGSRLGAALDDLNQRSATLGAELARVLQPGSPPLLDRELVRIWTQQRDATAFVLLGDPAARLRR